MKKKTKLIFLISILSGFSHIIACNCPDQYFNFCETINGQSIEKEPDLIALIQVLERFEHGIKSKILVSYPEKLNDTIIIWGNPRNLCRTETNRWISNDSLVVLLEEIRYHDGNQTDWAALENQGDYYLPSCGTFYLEIQDGYATGNIDGHKDQFPVTELEQLIKDNQIEKLCVFEAPIKVEKTIVRLTHFLITVLAVLILLNIWLVYYNEKLQKFDQKNKDYGLIALAIALTLWSLISLIAYLKGPDFDDRLNYFFVDSKQWRFFDLHYLF